MEDNYEPYGEEWEKEVMKLPKKMIVDMYKKVCQKNQYQKTQIKELEQTLKDIW